MPRIIMENFEPMHCIERDLRELSILWQTVFGDDETFTALYFSLFGVKNSYAVKADGRIASAFHLIPCELRFDGHCFGGKYLYAAATAENFRNRGYMGALLRFAAEQERLRGTEFICLFPANERLYSYYEKFDYRMKFQAAVTGMLPEVPPLSASCDATRLKTARESFLQGAAVVFPPEAYAVHMALCEPEERFPDRQDGLVKMPLRNARAMLPRSAYTVVPDGMLHPLSDAAAKLPDDLYLGLTLG